MCIIRYSMLLSLTLRKERCMMWGMCTLRCYVCVCVVICCYVCAGLALHTPQRSCTHHYAPHTHHNVHKAYYVCMVRCSVRSLCVGALFMRLLCALCVSTVTHPRGGANVGTLYACSGDKNNEPIGTCVAPFPQRITNAPQYIYCAQKISNQGKTALLTKGYASKNV